MGFKCGIVGLPNVGKSTLFNALTQTATAQAANYPFCTIEPNVGEVAVPEPRLEKLAEVGGSKEIIPARMNFVDIAGLVEGASQGEGLGNKFLANIRETDAIIYVLRCFENDDITHVSGKVDPIADFEVVETELMLADMESLEKRKAGVVKKANSGDKEAKAQVALIDLALAELNEGRPARRAVVSKDDTKAWNMLQLLTSKPVLFVANVDEDSAATGNEYSSRVEARATEEGAACVVISAQIEAELALLDEPDRSEYLETLGLEEPGLTRLIHTGYDLLDLQTYFTVGPKESRAWTIRKGWSAPKAAGVIHGDFEKGFIRAETVAYEDYVEHGGEAGAKEAGKMRSEGKDYIVQDGDVMLFRFNV
ncbi:MAG: redox-regulated ATPase YchF [Hyphomonas sp.]|jgi:GTP-binding protein YchF|uniref:redox-regulated ATPase YchF n=1 Tax=Hyphomonas sp. TaxID=87 RepID=UPI002608B71F|nr:redox-regulated ATPase YchF [Hyphomonas sp.]MDF1806059.1 redox-regulated ATPase YchF [Hyphomonas sp.]|tara:strand:+ start:65309 stop:66406 length:1098 start_codon:yes stop_codon:yes gene_type:complete